MKITHNASTEKVGSENTRLNLYKSLKYFAIGRRDFFMPRSMTIVILAEGRQL